MAARSSLLRVRVVLMRARAESQLAAQEPGERATPMAQERCGMQADQASRAYTLLRASWALALSAPRRAGPAPPKRAGHTRTRRARLRPPAGLQQQLLRVLDWGNCPLVGLAGYLDLQFFGGRGIRMCSRSPAASTRGRMPCHHLPGHGLCWLAGSPGGSGPGCRRRCVTNAAAAAVQAACGVLSPPRGACSTPLPRSCQLGTGACAPRTSQSPHPEGPRLA
jgi:hypothetical protein